MKRLPPKTQMQWEQTEDGPEYTATLNPNGMVYLMGNDNSFEFGIPIEVFVDMAKWVAEMTAKAKPQPKGKK